MRRTLVPFIVSVTVVGLCALALLAGPLASAAAPPAAQAHGVEFEITETPKGGVANTVRFELPVVLDRATSSISARAGTVSYRIRVLVRADTRLNAVVAEFQLERIDEQPANQNDMKIEATSMLSVGQREVVGVVQRADGTSAIVALTLK